MQGDLEVLERLDSMRTGMHIVTDNDPWRNRHSICYEALCHLATASCSAWKAQFDATDGPSMVRHVVMCLYMPLGIVVCNSGQSGQQQHSSTCSG